MRQDKSLIRRTFCPACMEACFAPHTTHVDQQAEHAGQAIALIVPTTSSLASVLWRTTHLCRMHHAHGRPHAHTHRHVWRRHPRSPAWRGCHARRRHVCRVVAQMNVISSIQVQLDIQHENRQNFRTLPHCQCQLRLLNVCMPVHKPQHMTRARVKAGAVDAYLLVA